MQIAVTHENGQVFQHFGHCEQFKVYTVENGSIVSAQVIGSEGAGHEALADMLKNHGIDVLICGGMGSGAQIALTEAGIEIVSGVEGSTDEAVAAYLSGALTSAGVNCDHHAEGEDCGCGCGSSGGCHCGGGCHCAPIGKNAGKTCRVHYRGTFNDGVQFDSSYDRGEPLEFVCGAGMMIPGFDKAVADMEVGQELDVHLMPEEAYGYPNPALILRANIADIPGAENVTVGSMVYLYDQMGRPMPATVTAKDETTVTFDANHQMAGQELNFHIQLVSAE